MWFGKSFGPKKAARRASLFGNPQNPARRGRARALRLEPLEQRMLLATLYANDNWAFLSDNDSSSSLTAGDTVTNTNDAAGPTFTATYGGDAYGVVTSGDYTGSLAGFETIQDAIDDAVALDVVAVLQGTYDENLSISTNDITLQGNTGTATDVVIVDLDDSGVGIAVTSNDVTIRDLHVTGAGDDGIAVDGANSFTAFNVQSDLNAADGFGIGDGAPFTGTITLTDVIAEDNLEDGASIKGGGAGTVAVSGGSYSGNSSDGIEVVDVGDVVTTNVTAAANDPGIFINGAASYSDVDGDFSSNDNHGIQLIDVAGNVALTRTTANDNDADDDGTGDGLNATDGGDGDGLAIGGNLLVNGASFGSPIFLTQEHGVYVPDGVGGNVAFEDSGAIEVSVSSNSSDGVSIQGANNGVFTNGHYEFNGSDGLLLDAFNDLFFTDVSATSNGDDGLDVNGAAAVTIDGGTFNDNSSDGIELIGVAAVDVTGGAVASGNVGDGADIRTFTTATLALLTTSGNDTGIEVSGGTTLNVQDWTALGNTTIGGDLDSIVEVNFTTTTGTAETADQVDLYETQFQHVRAGNGQDLVDYDNIGTLNLDTGDGRDVFTLFAGVNNPANAGDINLDGGQPSAGPSIGPGDRLVMADGGTAAFTDPTTGTGLADPPGGAGPIDFTDIEEFLAEDDFEFNDTPATATILGSLAKITLRDLTIHDPDDVDYFKYTAQDTGKLIVNMFLDHAAGDLDLSVQDAHGNVLGAGVLSNIIIPGLDMEHLVIPVVSQEEYWIEVVGVAGDTNEYDLEIENFAAPVPDFVDLPAKDQSHVLNDTGSSVFDDVTSRTEPEIIIEADLAEFVAEGIDVLSASDAEAGLTAGAAVEVFVNGNSAGFADLVAGTGDTLFRYTFTSGQLPSAIFPADSDGWLHYVKAAVRMFDGQQNAIPEPAPADGRTQLSEPLVLIVDDAAPAASIPDLLETSDSGVSNTDDITNVTAPAFRGVAEHNAIIRVFANGVMVGQGYVGSDGTETDEDTTDPEPDQIGSWEVTIEPLKYGQYVIETEVEDLAGNISAKSDPLTIVVAPYEPNDALAEATILGSLEEVTLNDVLLHNATDTDLYKYTAPQTGKLIINAFSADAVAMQVRDVANNVIATATGDTVTPGLDVQHLVIPVVSEQDYFIEVLFAGDPPVGPYVQHVAIYDLEIESFAAPVPYDLELQDTPVGEPLDPNSDTGRSQFDNVTRINTPTIFFRLDDEFFVDAQPANTILFREGPLQPTDSGYAIAIFDEGSTPGQPATPPQTPLGFATATADPGVYTFTTPVLEDGSHFLTARVQMIDPADPTQMGFGGRSLSLEIIVDTEAPPVTFGAAASTTDGLHSQSDTGVDGLPESFTDRITSDTTPTFFGAAEANAVVRLYLDVNADGTVDSGDVLIGQTVAVPLDGTNQFPDGYWEVTSSVDMNDPATGLAVTFDGLRTILVTAEDPGGEVSDPDALDVFIDTRGPRVTGVYITDDSGFDLFAPKPTDGPTPLVQSLSIDVEDLPERVAAFLYHALAPGVFPGDPATDPGHYRLEGDYNGVIPIQSVSFNPGALAAGSSATGTIVLEFAEPLPDDRFTLTISDALVDPAGNRLDGESNAVEPHDPPQFPSGDGQPGGDFVARFTVDSRAELGVWTAGSVYLDLNGNFRFDPDNPDQANRDVVHALGFTTDAIFAGNFAESPTDTADGFDKLAVYGRTATGSRWLIDTTNDGVPDLNVAAAGVTGMPVAGNFDDSGGANGDEVGLFTGTTWWFDTTHDFRVDTSLASNLRGYPIVGDYDGDGYDDLATLNSQLDRVEFDLTGGVFRGWDGSIDATIALPFGEFIGVRERPVSADMDGDGVDDVGLWVPDRGAMTPEEAGEWYFLISNDVDGTGRSAGTIDTLDHAFTPSPFGHDLFAQFGDEFAIPVIGNFDPPVTAATEDPNDTPPADPPQDDPAPGDAPADPEPAQGDPVPGSLNLVGTAGDDVLKVVPGATSNAWIATLNGTPHEVEGAFVSITFDGGGGDDVAVLRDDPDGQDTLTASPDEATLAGDAYSIHVTSVRRVRASSSPGNNDLAVLHDAPGSRDTLKASAEKARLVGETFVIRAKGFRDVQANATPGDGDVAKLRDSVLDDTLEAGADWARVSNDDAQFGFSIGASGFEFVKARSTNGGDTTDIDPDSLDWLLARGWL